MILQFIISIPELTGTYSEPRQTSKIVLFAKTVNSWKPLTIFAKSPILNIWQDPEYAPDWYIFLF